MLNEWNDHTEWVNERMVKDKKNTDSKSITQFHFTLSLFEKKPVRILVSGDGLTPVTYGIITYCNNMGICQIFDHASDYPQGLPGDL